MDILKPLLRRNKWYSRLAYIVAYPFAVIGWIIFAVIAAVAFLATIICLAIGTFTFDAVAFVLFSETPCKVKLNDIFP